MVVPVSECLLWKRHFNIQLCFGFCTHKHTHARSWSEFKNHFVFLKLKTQPVDSFTSSSCLLNRGDEKKRKLCLFSIICILCVLLCRSWLGPCHGDSTRVLYECVCYAPTSDIFLSIFTSLFRFSRLFTLQNTHIKDMLIPFPDHILPVN